VDEKIIAEAAMPHVIKKPLPPANFQPLKASAEELARYGYPKRPDAASRPALARFWETAAAHKTRFIEPRLIPTGATHVVLRDGNATHSSSTWSGAYQEAPNGQSFDTVVGEWIVPTVELPSGAAAGPYSASIWVGIDGRSGSGAKDVLQAGTTCKFTDEAGTMSDVTTYAWFEWYPQGEHMIADFTVSPGDHIRCAVCALTKTIGYYGMQNVTTGDVTVLTFAAPKGTKLGGNTAEWIVERATHNKKPDLLPKIDGSVKFTNGKAGLIYGTMPDDLKPTTSAGEIGFSGAQAITMHNSDKVVLANTKVTATDVTVTTTKVG
jgi:hypothetical protein